MAVNHSIHDAVLTLELAGAYEPRDVVHAFLEAMNDPACPRPVGLLGGLDRRTTVRRSDLASRRGVSDVAGRSC